MSRYKRLPIAIALRTRRVPRSRLRLMQPQLQSELRPSGSGRLSIAAERGAFALLSRRRCRRRHHVRLRLAAVAGVATDVDLAVRKFRVDLVDHTDHPARPPLLRSA